MDTVGSLFDKISIAEKRSSVVEDESVIYDINCQIGWMLLEIGHILVEGFNNNRPITFSKHKIYDKDVRDFTPDSLTDLIKNLKEYNETLWDLEDIRRDKGLTDSERLAAADDVSVFNKKRNDTIDKIDSYIEKCIVSAAVDKIGPE